MGQKNKYDKIIQILFISITLIAIGMLWGRDIVRMYYFQIPNEIREGANVAVTQAFSEGINPYRSLTDENGLPTVFYMYPILNNLIGAAIVKITGLSSNLALLLLNFIWTLLTGLLLAGVVKHLTANTYLCTLAFLMGHYCTWRYTNVSAFPDGLGVFLMCLILYLCVCVRVTGKITALLSFLTVLCFYSKQYTVVVALPVFVFLFLKVHKKQSIIYALETAVLFGISVLVIYFTMSYYFIETLLLVSGSADNEWKWAITQFIKIGKLFFPSFLGILVWFLLSVRSRKFRLNYVWISFGTMAVLLLYFGQNNGAHLSYYLQLWLPFVIILSMQALNALVCRVKKNLQISILYLVAILCAVYPAFTLNTPVLSDEQKANWKKVMEIVDASESMLATSQMANYAVLNDIYLYDYGQNQYIFREEMTDFWEKAGESKLIQKIFPKINEFKKVHDEYRAQLLSQLENKEFDVLMLVEDVGFIRDFEDFHKLKDEKYQLTETIEIETGVWNWELEIWR